MIVGTGCAPGLLTQAAIEAIESAKVIYGSRRAIELVREHIREDCAVHEITDYSRLRELPQDAVILSTGDPMLAGLGHLGGMVIPGISSLQLAAAHLHVTLSDIVAVTAHGKDPQPAIGQTIRYLRQGLHVFIVADPEFPVDILAGRLADEDCRVRIAICERLGYPDEEIRVGTPDSPPAKNQSLFAIVVGPI